MKLNQKRATILLCSATLAVLSGPVLARPFHHHRHHSVNAIQAVAQTQTTVADRNGNYPIETAAVGSTETRRHSRRFPGGAGSRHHGRHGQMTAYERAQSHSNSAYGGVSTDALVSEARKYIGTNPTGRGSLWCGAFMDLVLKRTGHAGGGNLASGYAHYGTRVAGPQVGAIAVMRGHVGVVSGVDANGNPIIVSGNHNRTVAESVYPRGRITAYVVPSN
jgi:uncharacterized protein (TIGR02594 family)